MKRKWAVWIVTAAFLIPTPAALPQSKKDSSNSITFAGTTKGNTGCAILEKQMPLKKKLLFAAVFYARTQYKVIQSFNTKLPKQQYTGTGEIKELNQFATQNKIKLVVIPSKYSSDQMQQAQADCKQ